MRKLEKYVDIGIFMYYSVNYRNKTNGNNNLNSQSLPSKRVKLIINKIDT